MNSIRVSIPSYLAHNAQTVAGFTMLREQGWDVVFTDSSKRDEAFSGMAVVQAEYIGKKIIYDHWDGYQDKESMRKALDWADIYFKRSFSREKNQELFPEHAGKMHPLGFNYHVTCKGSPMEEPLLKDLAKFLLGRSPSRYFSPERFEGRARTPEGEVKILFLARLWDDKDASLSRELQLERTEINKMRIDTIRELRARYGESFIGGLNACPVAEKLAPELIVPAEYTERKKYLKTVHACDICIGSMGLHESIGWKTGEYVAAAKAIVNERLHYTVPGDFEEGKNYLSFSNVDECVGAVQRLVDEPELLMSMKRANEEYYKNYLRPDVLVKNSLEITKALFTE